MAELRHNDDGDNENSSPQAPFNDGDQDSSDSTDANAMNYIVEDGDGDEYDYADDPQRFYIDGYNQENNPEDDDFDDDFDEDFVEIPYEELDELAESDTEASDAESVEETDEVDEEDEFDDLDADENIYDGEDDI
ncbi:MAG: hypothetical protein IJL92_03925 [Thermoguttaceae bacterium]|nr:hypothetical protein [Thermoguttaceae bacterium]